MGWVLTSNAKSENVSPSFVFGYHFKNPFSISFHMTNKMRTPTDLPQMNDIDNVLDTPFENLTPYLRNHFSVDSALFSRNSSTTIGGLGYSTNIIGTLLATFGSWIFLYSEDMVDSHSSWPIQLIRMRTTFADPQHGPKHYGIQSDDSLFEAKLISLNLRSLVDR